jgi:hypothetical protein
VKINVPEKYAELYLKALTDRRAQLQEKIKEFQKEIEEIEHHIGGLTSIPIFKDDQYDSPVKWETDGYRKEWTWSRKINYIFQTTRTLCTAKYVVDFILSKEIDADKNKVRSSVSAVLSNRIRNGKGRKFIDPVTDQVFYGDDSWFDQNEEPKIEHLPEALKARIIK